MSSRGESSRHRARELALQTLYAIDLIDHRRSARPRVDGRAEPVPAEASAADPDQVLAGLAAHLEAPPGAHSFARELISEVSARGEALDSLISARARNWRVSRMAAVDRNILRLGSYELAHTDTPAAVVINEAVELARRFGSDSSPAFVNGILDTLAHDLRTSAGTAGLEKVDPREDARPKLEEQKT